MKYIRIHTIFLYIPMLLNMYPWWLNLFFPIQEHFCPLFSTFLTNCPDGSHYAQTWSHSAQKTTPNPSSLLSLPTPLLGTKRTKTYPKTPLFLAWTCQWAKWTTFWAIWTPIGQNRGIQRNANPEIRSGIVSYFLLFNQSVLAIPNVQNCSHRIFQIYNWQRWVPTVSVNVEGHLLLLDAVLRITFEVATV